MCLCICAQTGSLFTYKVRGTTLKPILKQSLHAMRVPEVCSCTRPFRSPPYLGKLQNILELRVAYICGHGLVNLILNPRSSKCLATCSFFSRINPKLSCTAALLHTWSAIVWKRGL